MLSWWFFFNEKFDEGSVKSPGICPSLSVIYEALVEPNPEIKRQVAPPAATIIERLHLFIGNSDKLKQFVIDGF